jgi:hypothetical protein
VQLRDLAHDSEGEHYIARNVVELVDNFEKAFQFIIELMGSTAIMEVNFDDIEVTPGNFMDGSTIYDYVPHGIPEDYDDDIIRSDPDKLSTSSRIILPDETQWAQNQSIQWPNLEFSIGKVPLEKCWSTSFCLKAKKSGCYNAFGENSVIDLGLGTPPQPLPDLPICVSENVPSVGPLSGILNVWNLHNVTPPKGSNYTDFIPLQWDTNYNSTSMNFATEYVQYRINECQWRTFDEVTLLTKDLSEPPTSPKTSLDVRGFPAGSKIDIMVIATAEDAPDASTALLSFFLNPAKDTYINLT